MKTCLYAAICCFLFFPILAFAQSAQNTGEEEAVSMITRIYTDVSGRDAEQVDWEKVRSVFVEDAVIVLKTSREASTQFTVEEFLQDFKNFYESPAARQYGFQEEVIKLKAEVNKDMAFVGVVYASSFPGSERPAQQGIDFWLLTRKENTWKVVAVTNEVILPGEAMPPMFE